MHIAEDSMIRFHIFRFKDDLMSISALKIKKYTPLIVFPLDHELKESLLDSTLSRNMPVDKRCQIVEHIFYCRNARLMRRLTLSPWKPELGFFEPHP